DPRQADAGRELAAGEGRDEQEADANRSALRAGRSHPHVAPAQKDENADHHCERQGSVQEAMDQTVQATSFAADCTADSEAVTSLRSRNRSRVAKISLRMLAIATAPRIVRASSPPQT